MKHLNKLFSLFLFSFILSTQMYAATYEDAEPANDTCPGEALTTIVSGITNFTGIIESANSKKGLTGIDYSQMTIPNDGDITITWETDQNGKQASFLVGSSCDDDTYYDGSTRANTHTTTTFSVNANDVIYLKIYDGESKGYTITITYTIDTPSSGSDLHITKVDSNDPVEIDEEFYYIIDVSNKGTETATGVTVTDTLPDGMDMNKTNTEAASNWTCNQSSRIVTCNYNDSDILSGATQTIYLHVIAPSTPGLITNNVEVIDDNDSNATASEETTITAEIPNADNLCYIENTIAYDQNDDINASCKLEGNFYYGDIGGQDDCVAQVIIQDTNLSNENITGLVVTKMYAPGLTNKGSATASVGATVLNVGTKTTLNIPSYTSYEEGYVVDVDDLLTNEGNFTITDTASDYNPNVNGIALYADYNIASTHHFGRIYACDGGGEGGIAMNFSADVIDTSIGADDTTAGNYNTSGDTSDTGTNIKYIRSMVAADPTRTIEGVHLNAGGDATPYTPTNPDFNFIISPILINNTCDGDVEPITRAGSATEPLFIIVPNNAYSATGSMTVPDTVRKSARIQLIAIDPDSLSVEGQQCILSSSTTGNFAGVPSCANSEVQYSDAFGQDAWDRCGIDSGLPCKSKNHGIADVTDPSYDALTDSIYVNDYGCYLCTFNVAPVCSTDNFAIRPDRFDMGMTAGDAPNLLRAGEEGYSISLTAKDALNNIPAEYIVTDHNFINDLDTNTTKYFKDGTEDTTGLLYGTSELNKTAVAYMVAGFSSLSTSNPGSAQEIVDVTYNDVGNIKLEVYDKEWAVIDDDDTPMDCNSSRHMYICGELNVTFIPHHFGFEELNITNHAGPDNSNFTYIADRRGMPDVSTMPLRSPMAARVQTQIKALAKDGNTTLNFKSEDDAYPYDEVSRLYYEHPVNVSFVVTVPSTGTNQYLYPDANETNTTTIADPNLYNYIGFGRAGKDINGSGTRDILWDESNFPLEFNFQRKINEPANPFDVNGSYLKSIKIISHYVDPDDSTKTADINGSRLSEDGTCTTGDAGCVEEYADNNATFYYGRTRSSKYYYEDIRTPSANTPIAVTIYCEDSATVNCDDYRFDPSGLDQDKINEDYWYLSMEHNATRGDGNVTLKIGTPLIEGTGSPTIEGQANPLSTNVQIIDNGVKNDVNVSSNVIPLTSPMTVPIEIVEDGDSVTTTPPYTDEWLIYNEFAPVAPSPFYKVRFIGGSSWTGEGQTGHVVDVNASYKKSQRVDW